MDVGPIQTIHVGTLWPPAALLRLLILPQAVTHNAKQWFIKHPENSWCQLCSENSFIHLTGTCPDCPKCRWRNQVTGTLRNAPAAMQPASSLDEVLRALLPTLGVLMMGQPLLFLSLIHHGYLILSSKWSNLTTEKKVFCVSLVQTPQNLQELPWGTRVPVGLKGDYPGTLPRPSDTLSVTHNKATTGVRWPFIRHSITLMRAPLNRCVVLLYKLVT